jgi:hypothetical protein
MEQGLLWFDNNPNIDLAEKIKQAAARYRARMKQQPTVCYICKSECADNLEPVGKIVIKPARYVRPNYLLIGIESEQANKAA